MHCLLLAENLPKALSATNETLLLTSESNFFNDKLYYIMSYNILSTH